MAPHAARPPVILRAAKTLRRRQRSTLYVLLTVRKVFACAPCGLSCVARM